MTGIEGQTWVRVVAAFKANEQIEDFDIFQWSETVFTPFPFR